jgi:Tfp pilus assembly protein PilV
MNRITTHSNRHRAGVTLVEVIMAASLLVIAIVPILKALTTAQVTGRLVEQKTVSLALAENKLKEIQAQAIVEFATDFAETGTALQGSYLGNVTDDGQATLKTISVSVGYDHDGSGGITGREILVSLTTLVAKRG